uniref:Uncharacterized protein LOC100788838 n=1 Tax=Rhizophora mucronata TaxID=61149 RepID=A0A2P2IZJ2_RHIMU
MNYILHVFISKLVVVYFDDILIYNESLDEHLDHLHPILSVLHCKKLYDNLKKHSFYTD